MAKPTYGDGSCEKLPSGRWRARIRLDDGYRNPWPGRTFDTRKEAERALLEDVTRELRAESDVTVAEAVAVWLDSNAALAVTTMITYRGLQRKIEKRQFASSSVSQLTTQVLDDCWRELTDNETKLQSSKVWSLMKCVLGTRLQGVDWGKGRTVEHPKARRLLDPAEVVALIDAHPERYRIIPILAAGAGLRAGEVLGLQRRHVDAGVVKVTGSLIKGAGRRKPPKTAAGVRDLAVDASVQQWLDKHLSEWVGSQPEAWVNTNSVRIDTVLRHTMQSRIYREAREKAGVHTVGVHDLRHYHLTMYGQSGSTLVDLERRAGHSNLKSVQIYAHADKTRDAELVDRMTPLLPT